MLSREHPRIQKLGALLVIVLLLPVLIKLAAREHFAQEGVEVYAIDGKTGAWNWFWIGRGRQLEKNGIVLLRLGDPAEKVTGILGPPGSMVDGTFYYKIPNHRLAVKFDERNRIRLLQFDERTTRFLMN